MALEQNEIKKVITVDLGNTTTSLKEYKKHIDDLRGSLLQLDETSEEYQQIAQEIASEQDKLNEVMKVGKGVTDAAEGSYNQLAQTMSELKKQWRATADETERAQLGDQILEINDKLKELDASTGNYQRNVGDYSNAFEKAFDKCLDGITTIDGPLGELGGTVKNLIPIIKTVNATAVAGLSGVKKAIASTGIGLLIVAVGELVAHWDDLKKLVGGMLGVQDNYTDAVERTRQKTEELKEAVKRHNKELEYTLDLMRAQGVAEKDVLQTQYNDLIEERNKLWDKYNAQMSDYNLYHDNATKKMRKFAEAQKEAAEATFELIKANEDDRKSILNKIKILDEKNKKAAEERIQSIENSLKSEEERLRIQYETDIALANEYGLSTVAIEEKYQKDLADLRAKATTDKQKAAKTDAEIELQQKAQEAKQILERAHKSTTDELTLLDDAYKKELALLKELGKNTTELTQEYENNRIKIIETGEKEAYDKLKETIDRQHNELSAQISSEQFRLSLLPDEGNELYKAERLHELNVTLLQDQIQGNKDLLDNFSGTEEEKQKLLIETANLERQLEDENLAYAVNVQNIKNRMIEDQKNKVFASITGSASVMADLFGSLSDMAEEGSEEAKALAIMSATINALGAAVGAYKSASEIPYVGWLMGPIAAASALAAGMAQVAAIRSTNKDSTGSASSASIPAPNVSSEMASVSPLLDEQADINRMNENNATSRQDNQNLRVYVVDQDIRDANNRAEVVEDNTTF